MTYDQTFEVYLEETMERLRSIEAGLIKLEEAQNSKTDIINSIFRDAHSIKAGANLLELFTIESLSHKLENVLEMIRQNELKISEMLITACLHSVDKLQELIENVTESERISIQIQTSMLEIAVKRTLEESKTSEVCPHTP